MLSKLVHDKISHSGYLVTVFVLAVLDVSTCLDTNCTFVSHGYPTHGHCTTYHVDNMKGTLKHCMESCIVNSWCEGIAYRNTTSSCSRFTCKNSRKTHGSNHFYSLNCTEKRTFPLRGKSRTVYTPLHRRGRCDPFFNATSTIDDCQHECTNTSDCRGLTYDKSTLHCLLHDCPGTMDTGNTNITYYKKWSTYSVCTYTDLGPGTMGDCIVYTQYPATNVDECLSLCEDANEESSGACQAVSYFSSLHICSLEECTRHRPDPHDITTHFYVRECPDAVLIVRDTAGNRHKQNSWFCKEIREDNFRFWWRRVHEDASQDPTLGNCPWANGFSTSSDECMEYDTLRGTIDGCLGSCDQEAWCNGVSYANLTRLCYRFPCGRTTAFSETTFYSRICQETTVEVESTTTELESSSPACQATVSHVYPCKCPCNGGIANETFEEFLDRIVKPLEVHKPTLSSSIRKLSSIEDNRLSSVGIGCCGILVLVSVTVILLLSDLSIFWEQLNTLRPICMRRNN